MRYKTSRERYLISVGFICLWSVACRQRMADQPRYDTYDEATGFPDRLSARPLPEGVVSTSSADSAASAPTFPPITMALLERGKERFEIYCVPCHGYTGKGDGIVTLRGLLRAPPTFHSDRLRSQQPSYFYDVIQRGFGAMPSYSDQVTPKDALSIAAYIPALQRAQQARESDVPAEELQRIRREAQ